MHVFMPAVGCGVVDLWVGLHRNLSGVQSLVGVTGVLLLNSMVLDLTTIVCVICFYLL